MAGCQVIKHRRRREEPSLRLIPIRQHQVAGVHEGFGDVLGVPRDATLPRPAVDDDHAGDGIVASISIFENEEAAEQSNAAAAAWVRESLSDVITEAPEVTAGEMHPSFSVAPTGVDASYNRRARSRATRQGFPATAFPDPKV